MNVLITGKGTGGSFAIRGEQLGRAIGATVQPNALDVAAFDLVVLVKRAPPGLVERVRAARVPLVFDIVDAWPQPVGNTWDRQACMQWLRQQVQQMRPAAIVAATRAMAADCAEFGLPVLALPHHAWEGQGTCVIGSKVRRVGYQGGLGYLGNWGDFMRAECERRCWEWVVNPPSVAALDIVVALREAGGYAPRNWKSNVKLANAQGCGVPFIGNREAGYIETASGFEQWAETPSEMMEALDALVGQDARMAAAEGMTVAAPRLKDIAQTYRTWLESLHA